jgi:hypothetical protein
MLPGEQRPTFVQVLWILVWTCFITMSKGFAILATIVGRDVEMER